jgi:hypothetical protein
MLEDLDIERVRGYDTVVVLSAEYRQLCRQQARVYRTLLETGLRKPFSIDTVERSSQPGEFAAEEARAALVWSRTRAERAFGFAVDLFTRLPVLGEAMLAGEVDEPRARAFVDWTIGLTDAQAELVCEQLLGEAPQLTVGELIDRIKRACLAIDPDYAEKRYRAAVRTRRVCGSRNPDGTANLGGYNQPLDRIAAAGEHIDALARGCKRAGDRRPIDYIRSDLFLGLADGTFERMGEGEIIAHVLAHPYTEPGDGEPDGNPGDGEPDGNPGDGDGRPTGGMNGGGPGPNDEGRPDCGDDSGGGPGPADGPSDNGGSSGAELGGSHPASASRPACGGFGPSDEACEVRSQDRGENTAHDPSRRATDQSNAGEPSGCAVPDRMSGEAAAPTYEAAMATAINAPTALAGRRRAVPEVRVELATLLGENEHPGELPPWGPIPAAHARELVAGMGSAEWRYVLCSDDGRAIAGGLLRARLPTSTSERPRRDAHRGGIVEIAVSVAELGRLAAGRPAHGPWAAVLAELAGYAERAPRDPDTEADDPFRRTPGAALRRWVQQRDRQCPHPSCRAPARRTDQDHRVRFADGGPTNGVNLSPPCRHDHRLKDEGGWVTTQPAPGLTVWASPLGHRYQSRPPPIIVTLPEPYQDPDNRWDFPSGRYAYLGRSVGCACDEPCAGSCDGDGQRPILPPPPTRIADVERTDDQEPTPIFNPDERPPF